MVVLKKLKYTITKEIDIDTMHEPHSDFISFICTHFCACKCACKCVCVCAFTSIQFFTHINL